MKKGIIIALLIMITLAIGGCSSDTTATKAKANTITLPEVSGKSLVEAIVSVNGEIEFNPIYQETNELLPGQVISYGGGLKAGDTVEEGMMIDIKIASKPSNALSHDDRVSFISEVSRLTGPNSEENSSMLIESGIYGTDLGIPVQVDDKVIYLFGDSFSGANMRGMWTSNFIAVSSDKNLGDGLKFDHLVTSDDSNITIPIAQGKHQDGNETDNSVEVTKIPTGGIQIGDYVFVFYMSIRYWGVGGSWLVNYNQVVKSHKDDLKNWVEVDGLRWNEDDAYNFGQIYPYRDEKTGYVYIFGIPGGRNDGCVIGRVKEESFENIGEYEYQTSKGVYTKAAEGLKLLKKEPYYVVGPAVAEMSVSYNEYLGKYIMTFYRNGKIIMVQSETIDGVYTDSIYLLDQTDYNGIYGGFILPSLTSDGGKCFYMTVSCWSVYNVYWVKVVLA